MIGNEATVKSVALDTVPAGVVTLMWPVVAPNGTVVEICVSLLTMNTDVVPLKRTDVAPLKFVPPMLTAVETAPDTGKNVEIVGGPLTTKLVALVAVPAGVVTMIGPVVAPFGTVVEIWVLLLT